MTRKSGHSEQTVEPQKGAAQGGESINPAALPEDADLGVREKCRIAPGPGVPVSHEEYERLKKAAKTSTTPPVDNAQEDRPRKKK